MISVSHKRAWRCRAVIARMLLMGVLLLTTSHAAWAVEGDAVVSAEDAPRWRVGRSLGMYLAGAATSLVIHGVSLYIAQNEAPDAAVSALASA